ncbi:uncharacterized protein LOC136026592 [Artemia franciscana]
MDNEKRRWQLQIEEEKIKLKSSDKHEDETPKMTDEGMELKNKGDSDSDTMVTSYGIDEIDSDNHSGVKTVGDVFACEIISKLRKTIDNTADGMITHADSYIKMKESDKENTSVRLFCDKHSAATTKVKVTSRKIVSPPSFKMGLTPSNPIWEAFRDKE